MRYHESGKIPPKRHTVFKSEEGMYYNRYIKEYNGKLALFSPSKELAYYVFQRQKAVEMVQNLKKDKIHLSIVY